MGGEEFCMFIYDKKEEEVKNLLEQIRVGFEKNEIHIKITLFNFQK